MLDPQNSVLTIKKNSWKAWFLAARPKTLITSFAPIYTATLLAYFNGYPIHWMFSLSALIASLFIQIGTNLINDSLDFSNSKDTKMRLGPLRMTQTGLLSMKQVYGGGIACFGLALLFSVPLIMQGGTPLLIVLFASILAGYLYTGGPYPLAYHGLGELFVVIFFGWVITASIYYIQTGTMNEEALVLGTQMGLLATTLIAINNFRDIVEDTQSDKKTLAVRFGATFARMEITCTILLPFILNLYWLSKGFILISLLPLIALPLAFLLILKVWKNEPSILFNQFLGFASLLQLSFGFLLSFGFIFN